MSGNFKILLLLAVCISKAHYTDAEQRCLCQTVRREIDSRSAVKEIQVYPATNFCDRYEIVVTNKNGLRYCLNPELDNVKRLMNRIMKKRTESASSPDWCKLTS